MVYILIGYATLGREKDILGVYNDIKTAIEDIQEFEQEVDNYQCRDCDYGFGKSEAFTKEQIKNRICPVCGGHVQFYPEIYDGFMIEKYAIHKKPAYQEKYGFDIGETLYTYEVRDDGKILQSFEKQESKRRYKEVRDTSDPILIELDN